MAASVESSVSSRGSSARSFNSSRVCTSLPIRYIASEIVSLNSGIMAHRSRGILSDKVACTMEIDCSMSYIKVTNRALCNT